MAKLELHPKKVHLVELKKCNLLRAPFSKWSHKFCKILQSAWWLKLKDAITEKQPELANRWDIVFHYNNAKLYIVLAVKKKLLQFDWDVLHVLYSLNLILSDYYLFLSLKNLDDKQFQSISKIKTHLEKYFPNKLPTILEKGNNEISWEMENG